MKKGDLQIGPCWTHPSHRGKRLYPSVLTAIAATHRGKALWMFTDEKNVASQHGIERAGFSRFGTGEKSGLLGIYRIMRQC